MPSARMRAWPAFTLWLAVVASPLAGQYPVGTVVEQTPHNLTRPAKSVDPDMVGQIADYNEVCVYCHAPHGGFGPVPLWNRPTPGGPFQMPQSVTTMVQDGQPSGNSVKCLSCHAGTIGLDQIVDAPIGFTGPTFGQTIDACEGCHKGGAPPAGLDWQGVFFDTDLRRQHPFSLLYDPAGNPSFNSIASVEAAGLVFFEGKIQCMTCHEPHTQQFRPFLRVPASGGTICLVCHTSPPAEVTAHFW